MASWSRNSSRFADSHSARNDELFRPVQIEYKVKDANFIVLTDSVGNEPEGETAKFYVLKKVKNMRLIKNVDSNFATHVFYKSWHITWLFIQKF